MTYTIILSIFAFLVVLAAMAACMAAGRYDDETDALSLDDYDFACECALSTELADHSFTAGQRK
jgi:nitrogen fixation-related uncharacterized protein